MQYFEDMPLGSRTESTETYTFTAEEIKEFAAKWDPMPFHLDEELAKNTPVGGLFSASTHNLAVGIRLTHTIMDDDVAAIAALGWNDIKFPKPIFAGDTVRLVTEVVEHRESKSKPDRGIVTSLNQLINQHGELVAEYKVATMVLKRPV